MQLNRRPEKSSAYRMATLATAALLARRPGTLVTVHGDPVPTGGLVWAIKALMKSYVERLVQS